MLQVIRFVLRSGRGAVVLVIAATLLAGACSTLLLAFINQALSGSEDVTLIPFVSLCLTYVAASFGATYLTGRMTERKEYELRKQLSESVLRLPLIDLERIGTTRVLASLTQDTKAVGSAMMFVPALLKNVVVLFGGLAYLGYLAPAGLVAWFLVASVGWILVLLLGRGSGDDNIAWRNVLDQLAAMFEGLTSGAKELRLSQSRREDFYRRGLDATSLRLFRIGNTLAFYVSSAQALAIVLVFGVLAFIVFAGPSVLHMDVPTMIAFVMVTLYLQGPLQGILSVGEPMRRGAISLARIRSIGGEMHGLPEASVELHAPIRESVAIELSDVRYEYEKTPTTRAFRLGPISAEFDPGTITFIVGGNGSGKSTLIKILSGLYEPTAGSLYLGDEQVTEENKEWYRQHFGAVFSDFYLFQNLWGADPSGLSDSVLSLLENLDLSKKVRLIGTEFSTTDLSAGQRRRLALVAALIEKRPVLIFDEWAADQDPKFRHIFYRSILPKLRDEKKTLIVVTHDERYFDIADQLIKLDAGEQSGDRTGHFLAKLTGVRS